MAWNLRQITGVLQPTSVASWNLAFVNPTLNGSAFVAAASSYADNYAVQADMAFTDDVGNTYSSVIQGNQSTGNGAGWTRLGAAYSLNAGGKTGHTIAVAPTRTDQGTTPYTGIGWLVIMEFSNIQTSGALDGTPLFNSNATLSALMTTNITPSAPGAHIGLCAWAAYANNIADENSIWTQQYDAGNVPLGFHVATMNAAGSISQSPYWDMTGQYGGPPDNGWMAIHLVLKEASASGQVHNRMLMGVG